MIGLINEFKDLLHHNKIKILNKYFEEIVFSFDFLFHTEEGPINDKTIKIPSNLQIIIADQFKELDTDGKITKKYYTLCFSNKFIIIDQKDIISYQDFFVNEKESTIFYMQDNLRKEIEQLVSQNYPNISLKFAEPTEQKNLIDEVYNFIETQIILCSDEAKLQNILKIFNKNILAFLIRKSYIQLSINRMKNSDDFFKPDTEEENNIDDYVYLRNLNSSCLSSIDLTMNINNGQLFALKKHSLTKEEQKLFNREKDDYLNIKHPFLLHYFGTIIEQDQISLILEFVDGQTLQEIDLYKLDEKIKLNIILSIMIIIQYLHFNNFIYRDLKPNNLMIDRNNSIVLIDLDRMIKNSKENTGIDSTHSFAHEYSAPEISIANDFEITEKVDIYSLGLLINFILNNKTHDFKGFPSKFSDFCSFCKQCIDENPENRPTISKVIATFVSQIYLNSINNETDKNLINALENNATFCESINDADALYTIGLIYANGICVEKNFEKAFEFLNRASDQNHADSLFEIGKIYEKKFKDAKKAHELYQKSADLGNQYGQVYTGIYFLKNEDFQKAFHYFTLSVNQNNPSAYYMLGQMYYLGSSVTSKDVMKGIEYFKIAAKHKIPGAQYQLGVIYFEGEIVKRDSEEAIKYLMAASDQNYSNAQYYLGFIYYQGKYFIHNEEKAIHFATLAANQNNLNALRLLGQIYMNKIPAFKVSFDENAVFKINRNFSSEINLNILDKAIHYFSMAARQNDIKSINILQSIFMHVQTDSRCEEKYQYYLSMNENYIIHGRIIFNRLLIEYDGPIYGSNIDEIINYLSDLNDAQAKYALGLIYLDDVYVDRDIEKVIQCFSEAADKGCLKAQHDLSELYMKGRFIKQDIEKGINYLFQAAKQNDYDAQLSLLRVYTDGKHVEPSIEKIDEILNLVESQKNVISLIKFANICYEGKIIKKDINKTIKFLEIAEKQNCLYATILLGMLYFEGKELKQNYAKSYQYFSSAAKRNNSYGQFFIGLMYFEGKGVKQNFYKSLQYFLKSAEQKNKFALTYIALFLLEGKYIPKDVNRALEFLRISKNEFPVSSYIYGSLLIDGKYVIKNVHAGRAELFNLLNTNYERAFLKTGMIYYEGKIDNRCVNYAIHYFGLFITNPLMNNQMLLFLNNFHQKYPHFDVMKGMIDENRIKFNETTFYNSLDKASKNDPCAQFIVGSFYYKGIVVKKNIQKSIKFFYYSAIQGYKDSMLVLGIILLNKKRIEKSINFLSKNKFSVHPLSLFIKGSIFYDGKYVKRDVAKAIESFRYASTLDNCFAKNNLGIIFRNGIQTKKNITQAIEYFTEAIKINKNDFVASYNLAHIYFFEYKTVNIENIYPLLIHSANRKLICAFELLCLIVYEKYGYSVSERVEFEKILKKYDPDTSKSLADDVFNYINIEIIDSKFYENLYEKIRNVQLIYTFDNDCIFPTIENEKLRDEFSSEIYCSNIDKKMINEQFKEGFGC